MSNYGPPSYGQPADPWGDKDPWGGQPPSAPPGTGSPSGAYDQDPRGYGPDPHGYGPDPRGYEQDPRRYDQDPRGYDQDPRRPEQGYGPPPGYSGPPPGYGGQEYGPPTQGYPATQQYGEGSRYAESQPAYPQRQQYSPGYPQQYEPDYPPAWTPATGSPPPRKRKFSPVLALVVTLAILVCGGTGVAVWLLGREDNGEQQQTTTQGTTGPTAEPTASASASPSPQSSTDARFVDKGQCVKNTGTAEVPKLTITKCAAKTYQVLERIDAPTSGKADAQTKCNRVAGFTNYYYFDSPLDLNDFVLCLKLLA
jgi:hypothetical protein